jgi:hypothetical protein
MKHGLVCGGEGAQFVAAIFFTSVLPKVIAQRNFQQHLSTPEIIAKSLLPALLWRFQLNRSWFKKKKKQKKNALLSYTRTRNKCSL